MLYSTDRILTTHAGSLPRLVAWFAFRTGSWLPRSVACSMCALADIKEMAVLDEPRLLAANPWVTRRPITVDEYHQMGEAGILGKRDRVELIEGELVAMTPIGSHHQGTVNKLNRALMHAVGERAVVSVQGPIRLDGHSEPEPDFALLKPRPDFYLDSHARPAEVLLLIEVADTSLNYDRDVKRMLYARHAIPELWIVDLTAGEIEVCREPRADGYAAVERVGRDGELEPTLLPGVRIRTSALFR